MANRVVKLGDKENLITSIEKSEVYKDISMTSDNNIGNIIIDNKKFGEQYRVSRNVNVDAIKGSLHNIFTWIPGERVLLPEFGSKLRNLLYEGITKYNVEQIVAEINHGISEWEPRVLIQNVIEVGNVEDTENNTVRLDIIYTIPGLSDQQFVYQYRA